jgi:hypothetical protein
MKQVFVKVVSLKKNLYGFQMAKTPKHEKQSCLLLAYLY